MNKLANILIKFCLNISTVCSVYSLTDRRKLHDRGNSFAAAFTDLSKRISHIELLTEKLLVYGLNTGYPQNLKQETKAG